MHKKDDVWQRNVLKVIGFINTELIFAVNALELFKSDMRK